VSGNFRALHQHQGSLIRGADALQQHGSRQRADRRAAFIVTQFSPHRPSALAAEARRDELDAMVP
jgi:hypothetical protein